MEQKPLRLTPFTNWSLFLNDSFNNLYDYNQVRDEDIMSIRSRGSNNHPSIKVSDTNTCTEWQEAQHTLFQVANLFAAISLLTHSSFQHHLLFLRCLLIISYFLFILWAGIFVCMMDVLLWNCVLFLADILHVIGVICSIILVNRSSPCLNEFYKKRLRPLKVRRRDFTEFCNLGNVVTLHKGEHYSVENQTSCGEQVSILLSGRLKVTHDGLFLHSVDPNEFVDSPEFDSLPLHSDDTSAKYQVSITAMEDSLLISWMYSTLRSYFASNPFLHAVFMNILGKDISDKLYRLQELIFKDKEDTHPTMMSRNLSMVNVRQCLHSMDDLVSHLENGKAGTTETGEFYWDKDE